MSTASPRRRKKQPYHPVHDRMAKDLLRNAKVAPMEVVDPYDPAGKIIVMRSIRNDPLAHLHDRRFIDEAQYQAGRAFQHDFEMAERGPKAIDPSKEAVDGGVMPEAITEGQRKAARKLAEVYRALGPDGAALIHDVLIHGQTRSQISEARGLQGKRWEEYFGMRINECLHRLSYVYGFSIEPTGKQRINISES